MAEVKPAEVSAILREQLSGFKSDSELKEIGSVLQVGDGIARIYGLTNVQSGELVEFEKLILKKMENAQNELDFIKESLERRNLSGTDSTQGALKTLEDGADTMEKESLSQLAGRQQKFILNLEKALIRIKNGTYGICKDSGKLISKKRLRAVPHATQSIEAKLKRG